MTSLIFWKADACWSSRIVVTSMRTDERRVSSREILESGKKNLAPSDGNTTLDGSTYPGWKRSVFSWWNYFCLVRYVASYHLGPVVASTDYEALFVPLKFLSSIIQKPGTQQGFPPLDRLTNVELNHVQDKLGEMFNLPFTSHLQLLVFSGTRSAFPRLC